MQLVIKILILEYNFFSIVFLLSWKGSFVVDDIFDFQA
jgi:hypothetical protein